VLAAAFVLSFFLKEKKLRTTIGPEAAPAPEAAADAASATTSSAGPVDGPTSLETMLATPNGHGNGNRNGNGSHDGALARAGTGPGRAGQNGLARAGQPVAAQPVAGAAPLGSPVAGTDAGPGASPVHGYVRQPDGTALPEATVTLIDPSGRQAARGQSGADGSYQVSAPAPGPYTLIAMAASHQPYASAVRLGDQPVDLDVVLPGASRLAGTIRTAGTGAPLAGATVTLADPRGEVVAARSTDAQGRYLIADLAPGRYTLALSAPGRQPAAVPVTVADGDATTQDATLRPGARVYGTARTGTGAAIPDARVMLLDRDGNVAGLATTEADGSYSFENLPEGDYTVVASGYPPAASRLKVSSGEPHAHDVELDHLEA
jgi:hypothetical protein